MFSRLNTFNKRDGLLSDVYKRQDGYIDIINLHNGDILVINDNGKDFYPLNHRATEIAHTNNAIFLFDYIAGYVVLCEDKEVQ